LLYLRGRRGKVEFLASVKKKWGPIRSRGFEFSGVKKGDPIRGKKGKPAWCELCRQNSMRYKLVGFGPLIRKNHFDEGRVVVARLCLGVGI